MNELADLHLADLSDLVDSVYEADLVDSFDNSIYCAIGFLIPSFIQCLADCWMDGLIDGLIGCWINTPVF